MIMINADPDRNLALELVRVTEAAAMAAARKRTFVRIAP